MTTIRLDHVYVSVIDLDRAIKFYEDILETEVQHYEKNQWADFDLGKGCYFGLIDPKVQEYPRKIGNNTLPVFWTNDVDTVYKKVKKYKVKISYPPKDMEFTSYRYYCFECEDTEGNLIEIVNYKK